MLYLHNSHKQISCGNLSLYGIQKIEISWFAIDVCPSRQFEENCTCFILNFHYVHVYTTWMYKNNIHVHTHVNCWLS